MKNLKNLFKTEENTKIYSQTEITAARACSKNDFKSDIEATPPTKKYKLNPE